MVVLLTSIRFASFLEASFYRYFIFVMYKSELSKSHTWMRCHIKILLFCIWSYHPSFVNFQTNEDRAPRGSASAMSEFSCIDCNLLLFLFFIYLCILYFWFSLLCFTKKKKMRFHRFVRTRALLPEEKVNIKFQC